MKIENSVGNTKLAIKVEDAIKNISQIYERHQNEVIATISCGATTSVIVELIYRAKCDIPFIFIDTGYHFRETIETYAYLKQRYKDLTFEKVIGYDNDDKERKILDKKMADICCYKNKVAPLHDYIKRRGVKYWISSLSLDRISGASLQSEIDIGGKSIYKGYPCYQWEKDDYLAFINENSLYMNPLYHKGYKSIGCRLCTTQGESRDGRWKNMDKSECGLHL